MADETASRHHLFTAACASAEWNARQAWLAYLALGGRHDLFDLDAFLEGLTTLDAHEQDVLAAAVNERLRDCYLDRCVPYLLARAPDPVGVPTPVQVLAELLGTRDTPSV